MIKIFLKKLFTFSKWFLFTVLILVIFLLIFTAFNPVKSFQILKVVSGSMEPAVKVGSVVFIQKINPESLNKGEIITYSSAKDPNILVTHRLVSIEKKLNKIIFKTKGDANNSEDASDVTASQIKGKVIFSLPFLGYLSDWIRKPLGFGILVIFPAILIIINEILNIKKAIQKEVEKKILESKNQSKNKPVDVLLILILLGLSFFQIAFSKADFFDKALIEGTTFSASCWEAPSIPELTSPYNNTIAGLNSIWNLYPIMDWEDSTTTCPLTTTIQYQYESYSDSDLNHRVYQSGWLANSQIPASGTPEGSYYWRVRAQDNWGNLSQFSDPWLLVVDRNTPVISNSSHLIATPGEDNELTATISWTTNEPATTNLNWKTSPTDPWVSLLPLDSTADQTSHSLQITGLLADTTYYYQLISADQAGNQTSFENNFFIDGSRFGLPSLSNIVINEYLPNPTGDDNALMPAGEWVEIYNRGSINKDLSGWYLTDAHASHRLYLDSTNTISSNPATSGMIIAPNEFFVVYRNGDSDFDLSNNPLGDIVQLHRPNGLVVDLHTYSNLLGDEILVNKSFARYPDGSNIWFDPIPSPGEPNILEPVLNPTPTPTPKVELTVNNDKTIANFAVNDITNYLKLSYELTYTSYDQIKGVLGSNVDISGSTTFLKEIDLATCSGDICTYDQNVHDFKLKIILEDKDTKQTVLEKSL